MGDSTPDVRSLVTEAEWEQRIHLAACYRLVALYGWADLIFTHISARDINPAGFTIHSAVHAARDDAKCVLHVHSVNGVAVSAQPGGVLPLSQHSIFVLSSLAYHDYEGVALNEDEKPRLVHDLADKRFFMLRNHGLLTVGESVAEAFVSMYFFETTCMIQVRAQAGGGELIRLSPAILEGARAQWKQVTKGAGGGLAWPALLRKLDRIDPGYRA